MSVEKDCVSEGFSCKTGLSLSIIIEIEEECCPYGIVIKIYTAKNMVAPFICLLYLAGVAGITFAK